MTNIAEQRFGEHMAVVQATLEHMRPAMDQAVDLLVGSLRSGGTVYLFGNGGSAADAQHIAGELLGRFMKERPALRAVALSTDTSTITSVGNDYGFEEVFVRSLSGLGRPGDVAWGLSTSGNSPNVLKALQWAKQAKLGTIAMTGAGGGAMAEVADVLLDIPSRATPRIQEAGMLVYHILCERVEAAVMPQG